MHSSHKPCLLVPYAVHFGLALPRLQDLWLKQLDTLTALQLPVIEQELPSLWPKFIQFQVSDWPVSHHFPRGSGWGHPWSQAAPCCNSSKSCNAVRQSSGVATKLHRWMKYVIPFCNMKCLPKDEDPILKPGFIYLHINICNIYYVYIYTHTPMCTYDDIGFFTSTHPSHWFFRKICQSHRQDI